MRTIYAIRLGLTQSAGRSTKSQYDDLVARIRSWVEGKYTRAWQTQVIVPVDGHSISPLEGHSLRGFSQSAGDSELFNLEWTHPAANDTATAWVNSCVVARRGNEIQIAVLIRISTTRNVLRPVRFDLGRPRLVSEILDSHSTTIDDWPVPTSVEQLSSPYIQEYVDSVLLNAQRNLPVIMLSPDTWQGGYSADADAIFEKVKGFAHVTKLADKWAAFKFTDVVEKPLSCYEGAIRIYWPGFKLDDNPFQHKLFLPQSIRYYADQGLPLEDHLFRTLAAIASFRYTEGKTIRDARQSVIDQEKKRVDDLRELVKTGSVVKENLECQLLDALERIDQLTADRDRLKDDLAAQQASWAECQQAMAAGDTDTHEPLPPQQRVRFDTVLDAVQQAKRDFSGALVFLDSAVESAKDSPYKEPERVYELFEALAFVAAEWREGSGKLGRSWNDALSDLGFDLHQVSQTSKGKWGEQYRFFHKGHKQLFEKHITIGAKQADKCLSVHWYRDDDDLVLAIGHCGRHLSNTTS